jgi:membrane protein
LKDALNVVWEVEESKESGLWHFARNYVVSFAGVLALGFLLLVSLLVTTALATAGKFATPYLPEGLLHLVSTMVSFAVLTVLFAMMFKWLPDISVGWEDVWMGALLTALFFEVGKAAIGFYIGKQGPESTYGAAASIVVVLIWVYYTSQIILMGAEITHAHAKHRSPRHRESQSGADVLPLSSGGAMGQPGEKANVKSHASQSARTFRRSISGNFSIQPGRIATQRAT